MMALSRDRAIQALALRPDARAITVGVGRRAMLADMRDRIGARGELVVVEPDGRRAGRIERLADRRDWSTLRVVRAVAADAIVGPDAGAALFYLVPAVLEDAGGVLNLLRQLEAGGRVAAVLRARSFLAVADPFRHLVPLLSNFTVEPIGCGESYLAYGSVTASGGHDTRR